MGHEMRQGKGKILEKVEKGRLPTAGRQRAVLRSGSRTRSPSAITDATAQRSVAYLENHTLQS